MGEIMVGSWMLWYRTRDAIRVGRGCSGHMDVLATCT